MQPAEVLPAEKEKRFFSALERMFVGEAVDGDSGFINLLALKHRYFDTGVLPRLRALIQEATEPFFEFKEELFDHLYTFFGRYFAENGSVYLRHTPLFQNLYDRVYTADEDVTLFWKTHMLYYVKSDRLFQSMTVEIEGLRCHFDASTLEHRRSTEKRGLFYAFDHAEDDGRLVLLVTCSEHGRKNKLSDLAATIRATGIAVSESILARAVRTFEKQAEVDYYIAKDAAAFLREQFDLWFYRYVFGTESSWETGRLQRLHALRRVAVAIIDFISQFEAELARMWIKPKFVRGSHYVVTLDRLALRDPTLPGRLTASSGWPDQVEEWYALGIVPRGIAASALAEKTLADASASHLPVDTRYFPDLEADLVARFGALDDELDGWLARSDNFQALLGLSRKFRGMVQTCYIDPPYNTDKDSFSYLDSFNSSAWLTLMDNRLDLARQMLRLDATVYVQVDINETATLKLLLDRHFGKANLLNEIIWRIGWVSGHKTRGKRFVRNHDTIWAYSMGQDYAFDKDPLAIRKGRLDLSVDDEKVLADLISRGAGGRVKAFKVMAERADGTLLRFPLKIREPALDSDRDDEPDDTETDVGIRPYALEDTWNSSEWDELNSIKIMSFAGEKLADAPGQNSTQKPEAMVARILSASSHPGDLVVDFFAGTGTTLATAQKLGRKWIGVEQGEMAFSKALDRMKTVLAARSIEGASRLGKKFHEPCGISQSVGWKGGGFFKYFEVEQYEDVLRRARFADGPPLADPPSDPFGAYVFMADTKLLEGLDAGTGKADFARLYPDVDVAESLSWLLGKRLSGVRPDRVDFADGTSLSPGELDLRLVKPLLWWR